MVGRVGLVPSSLVGQVHDSDLSDFNVVILILDAVALSDGLVATVALGINTDSQNRILGFRVSNSENQQVCEDLLEHLYRRGFKLTPWRRLLAGLDGSLALQNAQARTSFEEAGSELLPLVRQEGTNEPSLSLISTNCIKMSLKIYA